MNHAGSRPYFVYTPVNYHPGTPVPLIVMLHGCTQTAADFAAGTQMDELADAHRFIVLYPQQTTLANPATCWNWFVPANQRRGSGEPSILAGMVEAVERSWNDSTDQEVQEYWGAVGASHVWTGGSPRGTFTDPLGPDLSQILYRFFLNHPLSRLDKHLFSG